MTYENWPVRIDICHRSLVNSHMSLNFTLPLMLVITISANTLLGSSRFAQSVTTWAMDRSRSVNWQGNVGVVGGIPIRPSVVDCVKDSYPGKGIFYMNLANDDGPAIAACINRL